MNIHALAAAPLLTMALAVPMAAVTAPAKVTITVTPETVELRLGTTKQFYASVSGATDKTVSWYVNGVKGGNATVGTISATGLYTPSAAVPSPNKVTVTGKHTPASGTVASPAGDDSAVTLLNPIPSLSAIEPYQFNVGAFTLKLTGKGFLPSSKVWFGTTMLTTTFVSATELKATGNTTAQDQTFSVKVSNPAPGASDSNSKSVKVLPPVAVSVSPSSKKLRIGESYDFSAYVSYSSNREVTWAVNGVVGGNSRVGTIDADGVYQTPAILPGTASTTPPPAGSSNSNTAPPVSTQTTTPAPADGVPVSITAASKADSRAVGKATVYLVNGVPKIISTAPASIPLGSFSLTINGTGFAAGAKAMLGGKALSVTSLTPTAIVATGTATPVPGGILALYVTNPDPGTANSNVVNVSLNTSGPTSLLTAARFLEQATWGPTPDLLARIQKEGATPYLNEQLSMGAMSVYPDAIPDMSSLTPLRRRFFLNAVNQPDQLRQRMAFAWSQLFVVSAVTVGADYQMIPYQRMLLTRAFDNYYDILRAVTLSPTMGRFLDMVNNVKANPTRGTVPNENYAREVLQLFTVGLYRLNPDGSVQRDSAGNPVPTYDEEVIKNLARSFTGFTYPTRPGATPQAQNPSYYEGPMTPWEPNHDTGQKTLMDGYITPPGRTATEDLDLALTHIFNHPNVGPFVCTRLIRHFVTSNPTPGYIARCTAAFNNNGSDRRGDTRAVLRAILTDAEAQTGGPNFGHLREPVLYATALSRALGAVVSEENSLNSYTTGLSQNLFQAPSVFNYYSPMARIRGGSMFGPEFQIHTAANAMNRANLAYKLTRSYVGGVAINLDNFIALGADPDRLLDAIDNALYQGRLPAAVRQSIRTAMDATTDNRTRARNALFLAASAGDYLVQH